MEPRLYKHAAVSGKANKEAQVSTKHNKQNSKRSAYGAWFNDNHQV